MQILGLSGSLRGKSSNQLLLKAAQNLAPSGFQLRLFRGLGDLPHFSPDLDSMAPPPHSVQSFRDQVASSSGLIISTPEYAHGFPGMLKNALDWLVSDPRFGEKPVALIFGSATDGSFARDALIEVLKTMSARVLEDSIVSISGARSKFNSKGDLVDAIAVAELQRVWQSLKISCNEVPSQSSASIHQRFDFRRVEPSEESLILTFLFIAARMSESGEPIQKALSDPFLQKYWKNWGRPGDQGVVAYDRSSGVPVSCAWVRQFTVEEAGKGFVANDVVELATGTVASYRGQGVGRATLENLISEIQNMSSKTGISLSVREDNPAVQLYQSLNFKKVAGSEWTNRVGTQSFNMLLK